MFVTSITSPKTKKSRWKVKQKRVVSQKPDENALKNEETRRKFVHCVKRTIFDIKNVECSDRNNIIVRSLNLSAQATLPKLRKQQKTNETWKDDANFNSILK